MKLNIKYVVPVILAGIVIFAFMYMTQSDKPESAFFEDDEQIAATVSFIESQYNGDWQEFSSLVRSLHTTFNDTLGWNGIPNSSVRTKVTNLTNELQPLISNISYEPLRNDLNKLIDIVKTLPPSERTQTWLDAHRIIHDLDYFVINPDKPYQVRDIWNATETVPAIGKMNGE